MSDDTVTINVKGLDQLLKALKAKPPIARVGIMGSKNGPHYATLESGQKQPSHVPTNAEVGAVHEFGSPTRNIVQRSFLRGPISDLLGKEIEAQGALDKDVMAQVIKSGSVIPWITKIAISAKGIVLGALASGGYGKWAPWKDPNYTNNTGMLLVDTTQLRNSITYEVRE